MDIEKINNTLKVLENLRKHKNYSELSIQLTADELEVLVGRICEYTVKLAKDNSVELTDDELCASSPENSNAIIDLQKYLKAQKRIFETAA